MSNYLSLGINISNIIFLFEPRMLWIKLLSTISVSLPRLQFGTGCSQSPEVSQILEADPDREYP